MPDSCFDPRLSLPAHAALVLPDENLSVPDLLWLKLPNPL